jgi:cytochrome c556
MMMIRTILITATIAIGVTGVVAQTDAISQRKSLMKQNSKYTKGISAMVKGEAPFDAGAVNAAFTQWSNTAAQLPKLFPDNSKSGGDTRALPKIWTDRKGFDAHVAAFAKAAAARPKDLDGLKKAFPAVGKACGNCHEGYRAAKKK